MKKGITMAFMALCLIFTATAVAQDFSDLDKSPMDAAAFPSSYKIADKVVKVYYGRPQLKKRYLKDLAPAGKVWRTGANEAAEITFYQDINFGGEAVKAGTYSLFTIPGESEWTFILNSNLNQWGAYSYDDSADVARATGKVSLGDDGKSIEAFSITFNEVDGGADMILGWDKMRATLPITW